MAKGRGILGAALIIGAAAVIISQLEKKAKQEGRDIGDVAKDSVNNAIENVKSGRAYENSKEFVNRTVENIKSGKIVDDVKDVAIKTYEDVKSGKVIDNVTKMAENVKDGVVDIFTPKQEEDGIELDDAGALQEEEETNHNNDADLF